MLGHLGRYQMGSEVPVVVQCDAAGVPAWPRVAPVLSIDGPNGRVLDRVLAASMQGVTPGTFRVSQFLGAGFATPGLYSAFVRYVDAAGVGRLLTGWINVLGGGNADGAVIAMQPVRRPAGQYLIWQTDSGRVVRGLNPR